MQISLGNYNARKPLRDIELQRWRMEMSGHTRIHHIFPLQLQPQLQLQLYGYLLTSISTSISTSTLPLNFNFNFNLSYKYGTPTSPHT